MPFFWMRGRSGCVCTERRLNSLAVSEVARNFCALFTSLLPYHDAYDRGSMRPVSEYVPCHTTCNMKTYEFFKSPCIWFRELGEGWVNPKVGVPIEKGMTELILSVEEHLVRRSNIFF